jgi:hypothetical protein
MIKITRIYTRPSSEIPFFHDTQVENPNVKKHIYENYVVTKKIIKSLQVMSDDKLEFRSSVIWNSYDDFFDFMTDVFLAKSFDIVTSKQYDESNGITMKLINEEVQ